MRVGRLTLINRTGTVWQCQCDCGSLTSARTHSLRIGKKRSCGCLRREKTTARNRTHGQHGTRTWRIWNGMLSRCRDPGNTAYVRYGAKGVTVCERWHSFENFLADMGEAPDGLSIERENGAQEYGPDACRWATDREQALSRKTTRWYELNGERHCLKDWARGYGIPYLALYKRVVIRGWDLARALEEPLKC